MEDVTLRALNDLGLERKELSEIKDQHKKLLEEVNQKLRQIDEKFLFYLQENGMRKYAVPGYGTVHTIERLSYKTPKDSGARQLFFKFLQDRGVYGDMITVNSMTLNAWAKREIEVMKESGCDSFEIPGIGEPTYSETLGVRKS